MINHKHVLISFTLGLLVATSAVNAEGSGSGSPKPPVTETDPGAGATETGKQQLRDDAHAERDAWERLQEW
ncbi:MAG: hypothetical protein MJA83_02905, partial [Gammaproteobacteria bacterium]|nr:hypothetical protein [Gammaproteobacteria bacterium]